jgi:hypothetical protein
MKNYFSLIFMLLSIQTLLFAQNAEPEYGFISTEEQQMTSCSYDKSAEAVVLYDVASSHFEQRDYAFELVYEMSTRIKILNEAGVKWAKAEIPFYREGEIYEQIEGLEGSTYNMENGAMTRTDLDLKTTYVEKLNDSWSLKKFAMPNVKVGSIVEFHYKIRSQYVFKLRDWEFQWKIPVLYSKYSVRLIPFYEYAWLLQGATKFDSQQTVEEGGLSNSYAGVVYKNIKSEFVMKNLPAFKDEEYISSINDYIIKLHFQLARVTQTNGTSTNIVSTWPELVKDFLTESKFAGFMKKSQSVASKIFDIKSLATKTSIERFDTVMNYVKANYKWNKNNGKYVTKSVSNLMTDKQGNDAELNLFALGLLNAVGVNATPVVLSTRSNGKINSDYPFLDAFNYVAISADVDGQMVLTDATDINNLNYRIPENCINGSGLLIKKDKVEWISLKSMIPSKKRTIFEIELLHDSLKSTIETTAIEYDALDLREKFGSDTKLIKKYYETKGYNVAESSVEVKNVADCKKPYIYKLSTENVAEIINNKIYISPFMGEALQENPLKQTARTYPVDLIYPIHNTLYSKISIPKGYKLDFVPENSKMENDQFSLDYNTTKTNDMIIVSLTYNFKSPIYEPSEYKSIKFYFNEIVNRGAEKIVLSKL